jgi:SET domain
MNNGHWLTCTGGDRDSTNLTREFLTHASKTNDLFTAGLAVIAKLISIGLSRAADEGSTASNESIRALEHSQRSPTYSAVLVTVENSVSKILEEIFSDFEAQYPCSRPFWMSHSTASNGTIDSVGKNNENVLQGLGQKRTREGEDTMVMDVDGDEDRDEFLGTDVSDVLEQQAHESWTLLQLLLCHEKKYTQYPFEKELESSVGVGVDGSMGVVGGITEVEDHIIGDSKSDNKANIEGHEGEDDRGGSEDGCGLLSLVVTTAAHLISFSRWSRLIGSLHAHLVPLLVDSPLIFIAKNLPNLPRWEDRRNILKAFEPFLPVNSCVMMADQTGNGDRYVAEMTEDRVGIEGQKEEEKDDEEEEDRSDVGVGKKRTHSARRACSSDRRRVKSPVSNSDRILLKVERAVVRLAQATSILPSSTSTSTSITTSSTSAFSSTSMGKDHHTDSKKDGSMDRSTGHSGVVVPTENPFNKCCFLSMALVPVVGTNMGCGTGTNMGCGTGTNMGCGTGTNMECGTGTNMECGTGTNMGCGTGTNMECGTGTNMGGGTGTNMGVRKDTEEVKEMDVKHATFVSHSCVPNAQLQAVLAEDGLKAVLVALRRVEKGDTIFCSAIEHSNQVGESGIVYLLGR